MRTVRGLLIDILEPRPAPEMEEEKCENPVDAEFNAAVDIVQALPKEGQLTASYPTTGLSIHFKTL